MVTTTTKKQSSSTSKGVKISKVPVGLLHLVTGSVTIDDSGKIKKEPKSLETLRNRIFFVKDTKGEIGKFISNKKGVVNGLRPNNLTSNEFQFQSMLGKKNLEREVYLAPAKVMKHTWLSYETNWTDKLVGFFKEHKLGVKLKVIPLCKGDFRDPISGSDDPDEQQYGEWYAGFEKGEKHTGILFSKTRAAFLLFNSPKSLIKEIFITYPSNSSLKNKKSKLEVIEKEGVTYSVLTGSKAELPRGNYIINVQIESPDNTWDKTAKKNTGYTIIEPIRFNIHNIAGEFDIINCDPVTLEESMIRQFPVMLNHITQLLKNESHTVVPRSNTQAFPTIKNKGLVQYGKSMSWSMSKSKMFLGAVDESSYERMAQFSLLIADFLAEYNEDMTESVKTLKLIYGTYDTAMKWKKYIHPLVLSSENYKKYFEIAEIINSSSKKMFYQGKWMGFLADAYDRKNHVYPQKVLDILKVEGKKGGFNQLLKVMPEEGKNLQKYLGNVGKGINKTLPWLGAGVSVLEAGLQIAKVEAVKEKLEENKKTIHRLFTEYDTQIKGLVCKESLDLLEKYRASTVGGVIEYDKATSDMYMKSFEAALSIAALTPTPLGFAANLVILIKETVSLGCDLVSATTDAIDDLLFDSYLKEASKINKMISGVVNGSRANQKLMPSEDELYDEFKTGKTEQKLEIVGRTEPFNMKVGPHYYHMQYRIRAEALYGVMELIMLASIKSDKDDEASFKKICDDYDVTGFIKYFILSNNWCYDISLAGRINLGTWWLCNRSEFKKPVVNAPTITNRWAASLSVRNFLNSDESQMASRPIANFQQHFPIHKYTSDDLYLFAKYFTPIDLQGNTDDWIDKTYVYVRSRTAQQETSWRLINDKNVANVSDLEKISPFCQIRILVILKEKNDAGNKLPEGIYPINLQLYRVDGDNCSGPVYRNIISQLSDDMLLDNESELEYFGSNRRGTVFHPFYEFGEQIFFGAKPLINSIAKRSTYGLISAFGGGYSVTDMRYAFTLKLGKTNEDDMWVNIGSSDGKKDLNEFRMGINLDDTEQKKLDTRAFLQSNSKDYTLPQLFDGGHDVFQYYVKVGNKMYRIDRADTINTTSLVQEIEDYNWNNKVEFYMLMFCDTLYDDEYKATNWRSIPVTADLCNSDDGRDAKGQTYGSRFDYLGDYILHNSSILKLRPSSKYNKNNAISLLPKNKYDEFLKHFDHDGGLKAAYKALPSLNFRKKAEHIHIYVAKLEMQYKDPNSNKFIDAIRPIASKTPKEGTGYFNYTLRNVVTEGESGFSRQYNEFRDFGKGDNPFSFKGYHETELTLKVNAPKSYSNSVPWKGLSKSALIEWVGKMNGKVKI